jgi:hypothetical protein
VGLALTPTICSAGRATRSSALRISPSASMMAAVLSLNRTCLSPISAPSKKWSARISTDVCIFRDIFDYSDLIANIS